MVMINRSFVSDGMGHFAKNTTISNGNTTISRTVSNGIGFERAGFRGEMEGCHHRHGEFFGERERFDDCGPRHRHHRDRDMSFGERIGDAAGGINIAAFTLSNIINMVRGMFGNQGPQQHHPGPGHRPGGMF